MHYFDIGYASNAREQKLPKVAEKIILHDYEESILCKRSMSELSGREKK